VQPHKRRGPLPTGKGEPVQVRLQPGPMAALDAWITSQSEVMSRPEAIRRLVEQALAHHAPPRARPKAASDKASAMARHELDRAPTDDTARPEEQERRKRRLLKGPPEFREMRSDGGRPRRQGK
jgi:hypothetical protein